MKTRTKVKESANVRRSVVLPRRLVEGASEVAPKEIQVNFNRLVRVALEEFVARREREAFEASMERMASDPVLRRESHRITEEFTEAESDGLPS